MITKTDFLAQLDRGAAALAELPLSSALLRTLAADLRRAEPRWWLKTQKAWEARSFSTWSEAWGLLLSCIHYEVIANEQSALFRLFPSCGGDPGGDVAPALNEVLADLGDGFYARLQTAQRRYYSESLSRIWNIPAMFYFQDRDLSYYLVEFGAGAGLNLAAEALAPKNNVDSSLIAARIGLDVQKLSLENLDDLRWLAACILPDQSAVLAALDKAINAVRPFIQSDPAFIQLVECPAALQPQFAAKNLAPDDPGVGLLAYNISFTGRMSEADYAAFVREIEQMLLPWGDRALWLEVENRRDNDAGSVLQYRLNRVANGSLRTFEMGRADFAAKQDVIDRKGTLDFLGISPERIARIKRL